MKGDDKTMSGCPYHHVPHIENSSLYQRLGGADAVKAVVIRMYEKILTDSTLSPFFESVDITRLRRSQTAFLTMAAGGPHHYTGQSLRRAHQPFVDQGLSDIHFDAVAGHLANTLRDVGVSESLIDEVLALVETTRDDVLCKNKENTTK